MTVKRTHLDYLSDMLEAAVLAETFTHAVEFDAFQQNTEKIFAVVRALEVIGEAAAHVPGEVQAQRPDVPWNDIIGMRHVLIHGYFGVDAAVVWKTVQQDVPILRSALEQMLQAPK